MSSCDHEQLQHLGSAALFMRKQRRDLTIAVHKIDQNEQNLQKLRQARRSSRTIS